MPGSINPNAPAAAIDDSMLVRMGHTAGPYGEDPMVEPRGEFDKPARDLRP